MDAATWSRTTSTGTCSTTPLTGTWSRRAATLPMINATDMANGEQFSFSQIRFDLLSSDLTSYPLARAVAASSRRAGPADADHLEELRRDFGFGPIRFPSPADTPTAGLLPPREQEVRRLMRSYADSADRPYIHLVDGAFSDNLGLREPEPGRQLPGRRLAQSDDAHSHGAPAARSGGGERRDPQGRKRTSGKASPDRGRRSMNSAMDTACASINGRWRC